MELIVNIISLVVASIVNFAVACELALIRSKINLKNLDHVALLTMYAATLTVVCALMANTIY